MIWFEKTRIPPGRWPMLGASFNVLREIESGLEPSIDLTEGNESITITGCMRAYRHAIMRRVLDLSQSAIIAWNSGFLIGTVVCARSLLETIATFHSFLRRSEAAAAVKDWQRIGRLVDAYTFSSSSKSPKQKPTEDSPSRIGKIVKDFLNETQPNTVAFWDQICDTAHPNGKRMIEDGGKLGGNAYRAIAAPNLEPELFIAIFNGLSSCCWLSAADMDFEILLAVIRSGDDLPPDDPLILARKQNIEIAEEVMRKVGPLPAFGPLKPPSKSPALRDEASEDKA